MYKQYIHKFMQNKLALILMQLINSSTRPNIILSNHINKPNILYKRQYINCQDCTNCRKLHKKKIVKCFNNTPKNKNTVQPNERFDVERSRANFAEKFARVGGCKQKNKRQSTYIQYIHTHLRHHVQFEVQVKNDILTLLGLSAPGTATLPPLHMSVFISLKRYLSSPSRRLSFAGAIHSETHSIQTENQYVQTHMYRTQVLYVRGTCGSRTYLLFVIFHVRNTIVQGMQYVRRRPQFRERNGDARNI